MPGPHKFYYDNSGAEAVECAIKVARYHTRRQHIIAFYGAFHGRTLGALSLTASNPQQRRRFAPLIPGVMHVPYPYVYRGCRGGPAEQEAFALQCARFIEERLFRSTVAGEGGYLVAPANSLEEIRRICYRHGILVIVDEVQSGIGRTGKWWAISTPASNLTWWRWRKESPRVCR